MSPRFRPDLQGLRAVAVLVVVIYHLRPAWLPGGFIGVDIFFVLSGFFITSSLLAETTVDGRIHLRGFWARRIRRLMPAATTVIVATLIGVMVLAPVSTWPSTLWQVIASGTSWENWYLAAQSVDYLQASAPPSPYQHFWSLGVEEQFYVVWPFLLMAVAVFAGRRRTIGWRVATLVLLAVSFAWSIIDTALDPSVAYFSTLSRAGELLIGAAIAAWSGRIRLPGTIASILLVLGTGGIVTSLVLIGPTTPFPSATSLLPTLSAGAIIVSGFGTRPSALTTPLTFLPVRYVGDISYSLYLWHWPIIVLATPYLTTTGALPARWALLIGVASVVIAVVSYELVERTFLGRGRFHPRSRIREPRSARSLRPAYRLGAALLAIILLAAGAGFGNEQRVYAQERADANPRNFPGGRVLNPAFDRTAWRTSAVAPVPAAAQLAKIPRQLGGTCLAPLQAVEITTCEWGDRSSSTVVAVVGDSHAAQWLPAIDAIAQLQHWRVVFMGHEYCTFTAQQQILWLDRPGYNYGACVDWNRAVQTKLLSLRPSLVIQGSLAYGQPPWLDETRQQYGMSRATGYADAWRPLLDAGIPVVAFAETPQPDNVNLPACATRSFVDVSGCAVAATPTDQWDARISLAQSIEPRAHVINASSLICPSQTCHAEIGNVLVYLDLTHLTTEYARSLAWFVDEQLRPDVPQLYSSSAAPL
jgi:peptidoglycan/LPS O-acetylase OafA/YrhL